MEKQAKTMPKDFFLWIGAMAALYLSTISFVILWFEYIDRLVGGSTVAGYDPFSGAIRFAIASLIVIFPVFVFLTRMLNQDQRKHPEKKNLWIRRWLVFATVFVAGVVLLIDLIVLINTFLGGEDLTIAFLLKVLLVIILAGGVFYYYLNMLRDRWEKDEKTSKMIGAGVSLVVITSIIAGFFIIGSPQTQRALRLDDQRINDLTSIQFSILDHYRSKEVLPETLEDLKDPLNGRYIPTDPETGEEYGYNPIDELTFEICANFSLALPEVSDKADKTDWQVRQLLEQHQNWAHGEGETCFEREIDPETESLGEKKPVPLPR